MTAEGWSRNSRICCMVCMRKIDVWMVRESKSKELRLELRVTPVKLIFERIVRVVLHRVVTRRRLDLDSKARLPQLRKEHLQKQPPKKIRQKQGPTKPPTNIPQTTHQHHTNHSPTSHKITHRHPTKPPNNTPLNHPSTPTPHKSLTHQHPTKPPTRRWCRCVAKWKGRT